MTFVHVSINNVMYLGGVLIWFLEDDTPKVSLSLSLSPSKTKVSNFQIQCIEIVVDS